MGYLSFPAQAKIALDTSAIIYSVEKIQPYFDLLAPMWQDARQNRLFLYGSELLLLEAIVKPIQLNDLVLEKAFRQLLTHSRDIVLLPITPAVLENAGRLRALFRIKTPDAIHLSAALMAGCDYIVTNDLSWHKVPGIRTIVLDDYLSPSL
jgi:predicted nucleic acid-binding protein